MRLVWRMRRQCSRGNRRNVVNAGRSSMTQATAAGYLPDHFAANTSARRRAWATAASPGSNSTGRSKIAQKPALTSSRSTSDTLATTLRTRGSDRLPQTVAVHAFDGADRPGRAVGDQQQRRAQPSSNEIPQERGARVMGFATGAIEGEEDRRAGGGCPRRRRTRRRSPGRSATRWTCSTWLQAERVSQRRLDIAGRQAAHVPGDHQIYTPDGPPTWRFPARPPCVPCPSRRVRNLGCFCEPSRECFPPWSSTTLSRTRCASTSRLSRTLLAGRETGRRRSWCRSVRR
jgi:hypothetical protein